MLSRLVLAGWSRGLGSVFPWLPEECQKFHTDRGLGNVFPWLPGMLHELSAQRQTPSVQFMDTKSCHVLSVKEQKGHQGLNQTENETNAVASCVCLYGPALFWGEPLSFKLTWLLRHTQMLFFILKNHI